MSQKHPLPEIDSSLNRATSLMRGLFSNTFFNVLGWLWLAGLAFITVPYILNGLGTDGYGVFGLISIVAGYVSLLNSPLAFGNIRFMAEAYSRREWDDFSKYLVAGFWLSSGLACLGAFVMFLSADVLARFVFKIPKEMIDITTQAFQIASISFLFNGITASLQGIQSAIRRYDILNITGMIIGTINTLGILAVIYFGWGLTGAVTAQLISSLLATFVFGGLCLFLLRSLRINLSNIRIDTSTLKHLVSYSLYLTSGQGMSLIGLQLDKTLIGIMLGSSALTYYNIPSKITEQIPSLSGRFTLALYPLSAESNAKGQIAQLQKLYLDMIRFMLFSFSYAAIILIVLSKYILIIWVGEEIAHKSWLVFAFLAFSVIWRGVGGVCYQVLNGLGRADINLWIGFLTMASNAIFIVIFTPKYGIVGVAIGMALGLLVSNCIYDIVTQRLIFKQYIIYSVLKPYIQTILIVAGSVAVPVLNIPVVQNLPNAFLSFCLITLSFIVLSFISGLVQANDFHVVYAELNKYLKERLTKNPS